MPGTPAALPPQGARKAGMTSNQHGPYVRGYTRVTMGGTERCFRASVCGPQKPFSVRTGQKYRGQFDILQVGTGDSPLTLPFYEKIGFRVSGRKRNFFVDNYDHPIFEAGKQLVAMIYLQKRL